MSHDFVRAVKDEIAALEAELREDIRFRRLEELRRVLRLYESSQPTKGYAATHTEAATLPRDDAKDQGAAPRINNEETRTRRRQASETKAQALKIAGMYIDNRAGPVPTREILEHLERHGVQIPGKRPLNNLSAILSNSGEFQSHDRKGWTRKQHEDEETETAPTQGSVFD